LHEVVSEAKAAGMSASDINVVCKASFSSDAAIYGETPDAVLVLAKKRK